MRPNCLAGSKLAGCVAAIAIASVVLGGCRGNRGVTAAHPAWDTGLLPGHVQKAAFSPDGRMLALQIASSESPGKLRLWVAGIGRQARPITAGPADRDPEWNPSTSRIVYVAEATPRGAGESPPAQGLAAGSPVSEDNLVRVFDIPANASMDLGSPTAMFLAPRWSPDGQRVAVPMLTRRAHGRVEKFCAQIALTEVRGGPWSFASLPDGTAFIRELAWYADGRHLAVKADTLCGDVAFRELHVVDTASGMSRLACTTQQAWSMVHIGVAQTTRTPCFVSCTMGSEPEEAVLYVCAQEEAGGVEVARLTARTGWAIGSPLISPDGHGIAVSAVQWADGGTPDESEVMWSHEGRSGTIPSPAGLKCSVAGWSPDSRSIAVSYQRERASRVVVYELPHTG